MSSDHQQVEPATDVSSEHNQLADQPVHNYAMLTTPFVCFLFVVVFLFVCLFCLFYIYFVCLVCFCCGYLLLFLFCIFLFFLRVSFFVFFVSLLRI